MPKVVEISGVGNVEFPDSMSDADIERQAQIAHGSANFDRTKAEMDSRPTGLAETLKQLGRQAISPITGIPSAVMEVADFVKSGGKSTAQHNLNPETASGLPGAGSVNPVMDAYGNAIAAAGTAKGTPSIHEAELSRLRGPQAQAPPAASSSSPEMISAVKKIVGLHPKGKIALWVLDKLGVLPDEPAVTAQPAPVAIQGSAPVRGVSIPVDGPSKGASIPVEDAPQVKAPIPITRATMKPKVQSIAEQLRDSMAESGNLPTEPQPGIPQAAYEAEARHLKTDVVAKALHDNGVSYADARNLMEVGDWKKLFRDLGQQEPGAASGDPSASIGQTLLKLKAMEKLVEVRAAPRIRRTKK